MVAKEGEVAAFLPLAPVSFPTTPSRGAGDAEGCFGENGPWWGPVGRTGRRPRWRRANPEMNHSGGGPPRVRDRPLPLWPQPARPAAVRAPGAYLPRPLHPGVARGTIMLEGFSHQYSFKGFWLLQIGKEKKNTKNPLGHTLFLIEIWLVLHSLF